MSRSGFPTKRDAAGALAELRARQASGVAEVHGVTLSQYLHDWLESKRSLRPTTRRNYESHIRMYLEPTLGNLRLADLRPHHIDRAYGELLSDRWPSATATTVHHVHRTIRSALNTAVKRRLIAWNPAVFAELPERTSIQTDVWDGDQLGEFLDRIAPHRLCAMFELLALAGLRRGEVLGLHWVDVDLDDSKLAIRQQLVDAGGGAALGPPKTRHGVRLVPIDAGTVRVLREHRARQNAERLQWGEAWVNTGLVFARENGSTLRPDYVTHLFQTLVRTAGLPRIRLHDLRHTHATLALTAGVSLKAVSARLGHSSIGITADLYTKVIPAVARGGSPDRLPGAASKIRRTDGGVLREYCAGRPGA